MVFTVNPSTPFVILPSNELTPTKIVKTIPKPQTTALFINFDNLSICTLSDMFEIIPSATDINVIGINMLFMKFPINVIINNIIGCNILAEAIFPVDIINVISNGIRLLENETKSPIELFTIVMISEKFFMAIVTINMYVI